ncbi:MAG TPA: sigma-70 family RNA polymerase sigma factor [Chthoniobacterales bacterium]
MPAIPDILENGGAVFLTTHWSVVLNAQGQSAAAEKALEALCRCYWRPLYAFVRREGHSPEEAQDLTQEFFARFLARKDFGTARKEKGRLRSFLLTSLKHFLTNERHRASALKRGRGAVPFSLDQILAEQRLDLEPAETMTAEQIYERRWATAVLDQVLSDLEAEHRAARKTALFERLKLLLTDESGHPSQAEIARELSMTENAVKQAFHRLRQRYRELLRAQIAHTVATADEIDDELRHLIAVLRA